MPLIQYEEKNFTAKTLQTIQQAVNIIDQYQAQGFSLTVRQLYYQFVARGIIANNMREYKKIQDKVSDARRAGLIDWNAIEDRTRYLRRNSSWNKPQDILESAVSSYHKDLWLTQKNFVEVWIEKDALVGVIADICTELDVPYFSCRGYVSDSEMWRAGRRARTNSTIRKHTIFLHLGDHDPSGIDMTRDIEERITLFSGRPDAITIKRIALTMEQIQDQNPPPNPAKTTDSRYQGYISEYGYESWELDALEPQFIVDLIRENILQYRDEESWNQAYRKQEDERSQIQEVIEKWDEIFPEGGRS